MDFSAALDEATGAVILPYDRFMPSRDEIEVLAPANSVLIAVCARAKGVHFQTVRPPSDPVYASVQFFGPWTMDQAQRFGFVRPQTQRDMVANGIAIEGAASPAPVEDNDRNSSNLNASLTDADWKIIDGCQSADGTEEFVQAQKLSGPWTQPLQAAIKSLVDQAPFKEALADLDACYQKEGLTPDPESPWSVRGADNTTISEAQIALAVQVVTCKQQTKFTQRVADEAARLQAPIIARYQDELIQNRTQIDKAVKDAKQMIGDHPEVFYEPSAATAGSSH